MLDKNVPIQSLKLNFDGGVYAEYICHAVPGKPD